MTYLVLARKWRPRSFDTLVGQDHVVRALTHALSTQRLHHAWLFTGTRGVGKTTLSRILAKSLNCHSGVTATPCGECAACTEIDAGRFVDYIELDAASNRGVDEMTQLLEQAVYSPSSARFKVYMIDEVHMLSGHAFNAMLKTLEEPPPHVKFILATTDPQKIPATVLSRCLQFNLKQMTAESIISYLEMVLQHEDIQFDTPALRLLAQAASGSMRDALSLTDQAIAYSAGNLTLEDIQGMLGTIDQGHLTQLLRALGGGNASGVVAVADDLAMRGLSYSAALADLAVLLSRVAIEQRIPGSAPADDPLCEDIQALAASLHPDVVQLFYSVAVHSRQELSLAPDEYAGFVMACLRMLSLVPPGTQMPDPPATNGDGSASVTRDVPVVEAVSAADATIQGRASAAVAKAPESAPRPASADPAVPVSPAVQPTTPAAVQSEAAQPAAEQPTAEQPTAEQAVAVPPATVQSTPQAVSVPVAEPTSAQMPAPVQASEPAPVQASEPAPIQAQASTQEQVPASAQVPAQVPAQEQEQIQEQEQVQVQTSAQVPAQGQARVSAPVSAPVPEPGQDQVQASAQVSAPASEHEQDTQTVEAGSDGSRAVSAQAQADQVTGSAELPSSDVPPWEDIPHTDADYDFVGGHNGTDDDFETLAADTDEFTAVVDPAHEATLAGLAPEQKKTRVPRLARMTAKDWPDLVRQLPLTGVAAELARQSEWLGTEGHCLRLRMGIPTLAETSARARFRTVLSEHFGTVIELDIEYGETGDGTAHAIEQAHLEKLQKQAEQAARNDPFVNVLISDFGGQLVAGSVRAVV